MLCSLFLNYPVRVFLVFPGSAVKTEYSSHLQNCYLCTAWKMQEKRTLRLLGNRLRGGKVLKQGKCSRRCSRNEIQKISHNLTRYLDRGKELLDQKWKEYLNRE